MSKDSQSSLAILIAHKNHSHFLAHQLREIEKCGDNVSEIIVVDDFSDGDHKAALAELAKQYKRIKIINNTGSGIQDAYDCALNASTADYVYCASCDDSINPEFMLHALKFATEEALGLVYGEIALNKVGIAGGGLINPRFQHSHQRILHPNDYVLERRGGGRLYPSMGAALIKRMDLIKIGGLQKSLGLYFDIYPLIILMLRAPHGYIPLVASTVRIETDSFNVKSASNLKIRYYDGKKFIRELLLNRDLLIALRSIKPGDVTINYIYSVLSFSGAPKLFSPSLKLIILELLYYLGKRTWK